MILPIVTYDDPVLRQETIPVEGPSPELTELVDSMIETMYNAHGVGLAAPQIGESLRLFVIDADAMLDEGDPESWKLGPTAFINPEIVHFSQEKVALDEGCLSLPDLRESIVRPATIKVRYRDAGFQERELEAGGWLSRVIQHEYDHLNGVLLFDRLGSFRRRLIKGKLDAIAEGRISAEYPLATKV